MDQPQNSSLRFRTLVVAILTLASTSIARAQDVTPGLWQKKEVLILMSTTDYVAAKKFAQESAKKLELPLNLRDLEPISTFGLTWTKERCKANGFDYPCYVPRTRGEDGKRFVSVEYSDNFKGFKPGYYIVVAYSGDIDLQKERELLKNAKNIYPDAYSKVTEVYMGCMH